MVVAYLSRGCHGDALFRNGRAVEQLLPEDNRGMFDGARAEQRNFKVKTRRSDPLSGINGRCVGNNKADSSC